jgi:hemolysin III
MEPSYSPTEERANVASAALGLLAVVIYVPLLLARAIDSRIPHALTGAAVFSFSIVFVYLASTLYHAAPPGNTRRIFRLLDHAAIFVLIAGTYTPFAIGPLSPHGGMLLLGIEWSMAAIGIVFKLCGGIRYRRLSNVFYLVMGWIGLLWMPAFHSATPPDAIWWIVGGGLAYTVGIVFYAAKQHAFTHFVWHLFVFTGTVCHAWAVFWFAV